MYAVWFCTTEQSQCWHPAGLPSMSEDEARAAANALYRAVPRLYWAYGPLYDKGLVKITGLTPARKK